MMKQSDLVKPKSLEDCGSHGYTDDEFEEYSEEEMLSEEEPNENLCMPPKKEGSCEELNKLEASSAEPNEDSSSDEEPAEEVPFGDESDNEDSCPEEPSEEDPIEEPEAETAEHLTNEITLEKASDEDPSDVSFEEIVEEESSEESEEEPNEEEPLSGPMDQPPRLLEENKASDQIFSESKLSAESSFNHCQRESNNLSTDASVSKQPGDPLTSRKKRRSRWDMNAETPMLLNECGDQAKKRSRWSSDTKAGASIPENDNAVLNKSRRTRWSNAKTRFNLSDTVKLPDSVKDILSNIHNDKHLQRLNAKLQEIHQKLEGSEITNKPQKYSSSTPQPIDVGIDSNESSVRLKLLKQKNDIILELLRRTKKEDKPKHRSIDSYKFCKKLYIPLKEYPNYNFVGLILGPSGNALKKMAADSGATILIRGKGADIRHKSSSSDDELHVLILSDSQICFDAAISMVEKLLVPVADPHNYRKAAQLRELAELKGTLRAGKSWEMEPCVVCGKSSHPTSACPLTATESKTNPNHLTGSGSLFSSFKIPSLSPPTLPSVTNAHGDKPKGFDPANLFVGLLPQSVTIDKLKELFLPYGTICSATVLMDKSTGRSKGYGFVKYTNASDAANAIEKMNGYLIDGRKIAVRIAGTFEPFNANLSNNPGFVSIPSPLISNLPKFSSLPSIPPFYNANLPNYQGIHLPSTSNVNLPNYLGLSSIPLSSNANLPNKSELAAIPQTIPKPNSWPGPAGSMLPESGISFLESNYNSFTCTESVPLQSSTSLVSSFQTSLVKDGYMMDGKKLNVANLPTPPPLLSANLPNYPQFAAIPTGITGSILPESRTSFPTNSYNSLKHTETVPFRSSTYLGSACQTSISSSQFHGVTAISNELASFPGYLKSIDPPNQLDQSIPSSSLSSQPAYFTGNFSGNHMSPAWR